MKNADEMLVGFTTFPSRKEAESAAKTLVAEELAACAQVPESPVLSAYVWEGETRSEREWELKLKFPPENLERLEARLVEIHPYECPQWYALKPHSVYGPYARWVRGG